MIKCMHTQTASIGSCHVMLADDFMPDLHNHRDGVYRWPFGRGIRHKQLPTTLEELHAQRAAKKAAKAQKQGHHGAYNEASFTDIHPQPYRGPLARHPSNVDVV